MSIHENNVLPEEVENEQESCCCQGSCVGAYEEATINLSGDCMSESEESELPETFASEDAEPADESHKKDRSTAEHKGKQKSPRSGQWQEFIVELEKQPSIEQKMQFVIDFMEKALAQSGSPNFRNFWDARTLCLTLFKENMSPAVRAVLWNKYTELSKEARRLKEIFDEQSSFATEQIEIAIKALENEVAAFDEQLAKMPASTLDIGGQALGRNAGLYQDLQRQLDLLNTQATRINGLRKELIKTEMRVRFKNKFFQRLSAIGDHVFPRRKDLIKSLSQTFLSDVDAFMAMNFKEEIRESLYVLRDEIKYLQNIAKVLTLNTNAFTHTRMRLSECWDKIKGEEKERKKEWSEQRVQQKQNSASVQEKIDAYKAGAEEMQSDDALQQLDEIASFMRGVSLAREDVVALKTQIQDLRKPIHEKIEAVEQAKLAQSQEKDRQRRQRVLDLQQEIAQLIAKADTVEYDALVIERDALLAKIAAATILKNERIELERQFKPLRDILSSQREKALMKLSQNDREALDQFKELLKERKARRQEVKDQLEQYRKLSGGSGLDFEQAMKYNALIAQEKETLEKVNAGIEEIEEKIAEIEGD